MKEVIGKDLKKGQKYYLIFDKISNKFSIKAIFKGKIKGGLYFKPLEEHPFTVSFTQPGLIGFLDDPNIGGFYEVEEEL